MKFFAAILSTTFLLIVFTQPALTQPDQTSFVQIATSQKNNAQKPSLALNKHGLPTIAWIENIGGTQHAQVQRFDGKTWTQLGTSLNHNPQWNANDLSLALDTNDTPIVAWTERSNISKGKTTGAGRIYVAKWNGEAWKMFGDSPSKSTNKSAGLPILRLDQKNYPVISWNELSPDFNANSFFVSRWNGTNWTDVDNGSLSTDVSSASRSNDLAITKNGTPMLAWSIQLFKNKIRLDFNQFIGTQHNGRWTPLGGNSVNINEQHYAAAPSIALDPQDNPSIVWSEANAGFDIFCKRWDGKNWQRLGETVNGATGLGNNPKIALDKNNNPIVAWLENAGSLKVMVRRWNNRAWIAVGKFLNVNSNAYASEISMALDQNAMPVVAWQEEHEKNLRVYIRHWNGKAWVGY